MITSDQSQLLEQALVQVQVQLKINTFKQRLTRINTIIKYRISGCLQTTIILLVQTATISLDQAVRHLTSNEWELVRNQEQTIKQNRRALGNPTKWVNNAKSAQVNSTSSRESIIVGNADSKPFDYLILIQVGVCSMQWKQLVCTGVC